MNKSIALNALAALSLTALLAACNSTKDDPLTLKYEQHGRLSDLTQLTDYTSSYKKWKLNVDTAGQQGLKGECTWTGYLGDSDQVTGQTASAGLYTNDSMMSTKSAADFRVNGVVLSRDTIAQTTALTHYRADFTCEY